MLLIRLPPDLFNAIVAQLNPRETRMLARSSKKTAKKVWRRTRFSMRDFAYTLSMFRYVDSVAPDHALVKKVTPIARNPHRVLALYKWIKSQSVGIDAGGFFAPHRDNRRVRIKLWDRPLRVRHIYHSYDFKFWSEPVTVLVSGFSRFVYNA